MHKLKTLTTHYKDHWVYGGMRGVIRLSLAIVLRLFRTVLTTLPLQWRWCPCCGWRGSTFLPYIAGGYVTFQVRCPRCDSHARHRGHRLFYERILHMDHTHGMVLYVAPESPIIFLQSNPQLRIVTSNYHQRADINVDIMHLPFVEKSWDFIICHRVLEHVADDYQAMFELHRVLGEDGIAIISVPIDKSCATTVKYKQPNPLEDDHYYRYGRDFQDRLAGTFDITVYHFSAIFSRREFNDMALFEDDIFVCKRRS